MLRLRGNRPMPESDDGLSFELLCASETTELIGSINSRSGLGMPNGAKSDPRKEDEAIRTVAAASEYEGMESLSGFTMLGGGGLVAGIFSSSSAFIFEVSAVDVCWAGMFLSVDTTGAEIEALEKVVFELPDVELSVPCDDALVTVSARR
jgi:hypothetical protein